MFTSVQQIPTAQNLALFKLKGRIQFTKYVQPICLRPVDDSSFSSIMNQNGYLVSYGQYNHGDQPEEMVMPIVPKYKCLLDHFSLVAAAVNKEVYCAGTRNGTGPSAQDVGTGLFIQRGNNWFLAGAFFRRAFPAYETTETFYKRHFVMFLDLTRF